MSNFIVRKAAVLGAGVMGAQIAAHFANAEVPVVLFDLPAREGDPNGIVRRAIDALKKLEPSPLATKDRVDYIDAANYSQHLDQLRDCDLIIEAIAERTEWKDDLYRQIAPFVSPAAIVASNTSGLSIKRLSEGLPEALRSRFCGIHFFNPPRYMPLVELISTNATNLALLDDLEGWLVSRLGKGIVRARDTPNFVANRVGVFSMLAVMHHTQRLGLGFDVVDSLTGPIIGRPKSATYRTADVVGLDTLAHVVKTMQDTLPTDPWHGYFGVPAWLTALIGQGALGQKTRCGIFRKDGRAIKVLDLTLQAYRDSAAHIDPSVLAILKNRDPAGKFAQLRASEHPQAQFLWAIFRDIFHYAAYHLADIADNARDLDFAMRWGFGWSEGPFESWQAAGWLAIAEAVRADINAGRAMSQAALPAWVFGRVAQEGVHGAQGSYSASADAYRPRSTLPVYQRQIFPEQLLGENTIAGSTVWENDGVRMWTLPQIDAGIAIVSVKTRNHTLGRDVIVGLQEAVARAEADYQGLVLWHEAPFAFGANLKEVTEAIAAGDFDLLERYVGEFQNASMCLKYAKVPVIAAVQGMALGGGCEFIMHATKRVIALESYIGLVEAGVGLIPAGGGCKEFAIRAAQQAARTAGNDPFEFIQPVFMTIAMATVSKSGAQARELGFAVDTDRIVFNAHELLYVALREARALAEAGYYPRLSPRAIKVAGRTGIANCVMLLANMKEGGMISAHDYAVAKAAATALCGGDIETGSLVDEQWLLTVERKLFVELLKNPKTQQRIQHLLETGKPLRN
ncbi:MAG TPA: 3-hydroxyacyl-CoA dehydrogenase/enoyl-CoA hydratase family protein [Accumulibacter sp.]|uniref:3-hydroxyacyl-CoA dehydrogenase n=1 Tax=Candidatus Accumulibacter cognatus TaxID=2954383 RepID=A0A080MAL7_9PROT|nr:MULTISPECIES: 3-hydroxyacyl-CoA dehydrogenase/enoyl-CoA hydratase family protein [Candidatus Accumulibacter]MCC2868517.1 3-hydroxyacyl-CoA dehydrogenase/enoyl-CoA hydratase family protein [Candidatus Accumulibacter phosphatis]KFB78352.1 MAG: putative 3-hydroxyacyl-CoA dehydrogenase [Candidatus Accumulibacter cognatus]MBN8516712.1 3-hydroxyacyl-CoA dehydrogenase/enoyl-CoA hydratase family protein [Accumulibacter sp.]MCM8580530.1 3-hydroxyacyl-CoA dehydrogenase/enoyl-CoA hydratase family prote